MVNVFYLYSNDVREKDNELPIVRELFGEGNVSSLITDIPKGSIVVPRFRAIPFGKELELEVSALGSCLINSYCEHRNIASLYNWVDLLDGFTPPAYRLEDLPYIPEGEYFIKGETNSIKNQWFDKAYAPTKKDVIKIVNNVLNDQYVGVQEVAIRPYQHFRKIYDGVDGRPIFHERRIFVLDGKILSEGFYWSNFVNEVGNVEILNPSYYKELVNETIKRTTHLARFYVIDVAEYPDGSWAVIELNDGSMSGLSENSPLRVWSQFKAVLENK